MFSTTLRRRWAHNGGLRGATQCITSLTTTTILFTTTATNATATCQGGLILEDGVAGLVTHPVVSSSASALPSSACRLALAQQTALGTGACHQRGCPHSQPLCTFPPIFSQALVGTAEKVYTSVHMDLVSPGGLRRQGRQQPFSFNSLVKDPEEWMWQH